MSVQKGLDNPGLYISLVSVLCPNTSVKTAYIYCCSHL